MRVNKIPVGIIGGAGYAGGELIRLMLNHPYVTISCVQSTSNAGNLISKVHADLTGETALQFSAVLNTDIEVIFLCLGHGNARQYLTENNIDPTIKIIDLSQDFRLINTCNLKERNFIYGLPELNKEAIKTAQNIANPGCFATAVQLGLLPLAKAGLLTEIYTTGITGSTGAGQGLSATSHFSWRANNIQAYKTLSHQHLNEIGETLLQLQPAGVIDLNFVPWRGDFPRGIFISSQIKTDKPLQELVSLYKTYYEDHPFVTVSEEPIFMKQVVNTNKCILQLEKVNNTLVVHSAIDNLIKGASGQAMQNMNLMFGLPENAGLQLKAIAF